MLSALIFFSVLPLGNNKKLPVVDKGCATGNRGFQQSDFRGWFYTEQERPEKLWQVILWLWEEGLCPRGGRTWCDPVLTGRNPLEINKGREHTMLKKFPYLKMNEKCLKCLCVCIRVCIYICVCVNVWIYFAFWIWGIFFGFGDLSGVWVFFWFCSSFFFRFLCTCVAWQSK